MEGTPFGRYRLLSLLGRGGMGEVWRAYDTGTERTVAVKVLPAHLVDDAVFQERFRREARTAANLNEPHVVPIYDFGEIDGRLFVSMRLIEGHDLQTVLAKGPLEPTRAVAIVEQIASALHAAHRMGLVHRDVKPSNILIDEDDFAYLIDFGVARAAGETGLTHTGFAVGTWAYMAPELFNGEAPDPRTDVYSLACVLCESLTGRPPFPGDTPQQVAVGHMFTPPPQPSRIRGAVPTAMDEVIATGMFKKPQHRYATSKGLASAARAALTPPPEQPQHPQQRSPTDPVATVVRGIPDQTIRLTPRTPSVTKQALHTPPPRHSSDDGKGIAPAQPAPLLGMSRTRTVMLAGFALFVAGGLVLGIVIIWKHYSGGQKGPGAATVVASELSGLLLSAAEINNAMSATNMTVIYQGQLSAAPDVISPPKCRVGWSVDSANYEGSGSTASEQMQLNDTPPGNTPQGNFVDQAVVQFPSPQEAVGFVNASKSRWSVCSYEIASDTKNSQSTQWTKGAVSIGEDVLYFTRWISADNVSWRCQRALKAASNVVVDVTVCRENLSDQAVSVANRIAARVPH